MSPFSMSAIAVPFTNLPLTDFASSITQLGFAGRSTSDTSTIFPERIIPPGASADFSMRADLIPTLKPV